MKINPLSHASYDQSLELSKRIELVMATYKKLGYINRKSLVITYGITQQQAGSLMRDFIHEHARRIQWDMTHSHYCMTD